MVKEILTKTTLKRELPSCLEKSMFYYFMHNILVERDRTDKYDLQHSEPEKMILNEEHEMQLLISHNNFNVESGS